MNRLTRTHINANNSVANDLYDVDEELIEIDHHNHKTDNKPIIKNDKNQKIIVRKKQLMDSLNTRKLTYVKGGICDSFIKFGFPSLEQVISDVEEMTKNEERRLMRLIKELRKKDLTFDSRVTYYKEYIEQDTDLKTAIIEGMKEWFFINMTDYVSLVKQYNDEDRAQVIALDRYVDEHGYDEHIRKYVGDDYRKMQLAIY